MRTWFSIANMIAVICLVIIMTIISKNIDVCEEQFNETRLIMATEYAAEAAFINSVTIAENQTTYSGIDATLLTKDTLRIFHDMMSLSFNMSICESNDIAIEESIAVMCLAGTDGYYVTDRTEVGNGEYRLVWTPKLPYSITMSRANSSMQDAIAVTLSDERWFLSLGNGHSIESGQTYNELYECLSENNITWIDPYNENNSVQLDEMFFKSVVSSALTNAMAHRSQDRFNENYVVYIPTVQTYNGLNDIDSPSLLIVINNATYSGYKGTCSTMQGFKVTWDPKVIAFETNTGERRYCYEGQTQYLSNGMSNSVVFKTVEDAARAGYDPDIYALMQPVATGY